MIVERVPFATSQRLKGLGERRADKGLPKRNRGVTESSPVSVEHSRSVSAKQRDLIRSFALLAQRDNCKGAASRRLPIDRQVLGVGLCFNSYQHIGSRQGRSPSRVSQVVVSYLHQVRVPGISADAQIIVAKLLLCGLAKDVS